MSIKTNRMTNANVYIDGASFLGRAEEIDLPKIVMKMTEHKALGLVGAIELPSGIEKMEARIKWNSAYEEVMSVQGDPFTVHNFQCRASVEEYNSGSRTAEVPYVCYFRGQFKGIAGGNFKQHDNVEMESNIAVTYIKIEYAGGAKIEFDALENIYKVNGVNILAQYKANIGG